MYQSPYDRCGLASLDDLETPESRVLLAHLAATQDEFLAVKPHPVSYIWPRDALHTWSRVWEYPYVFHHLEHFRTHRSSQRRPPLVVDFGSGITFFPFAVSRQGFDVVCVDEDPACDEGVRNATRLLSTKPGHVRFQLCQRNVLPFANESVDCIVSISVLEHMPEHHSILGEFFRILAPGGLLLLTIDISLENGSALGVSPPAYTALLSSIDRYFHFKYARLPVHPATILSNTNSPCAKRYFSRAGAAWWSIKQDVLKPLMGRQRTVLQCLACEGAVLTKRDAEENA